jgi:hypothetical protein
MQQWRPASKPTNDFKDVRPRSLNPVGVDFKKDARIKFFQQLVKGQLPVDLVEFKVVVVIEKRKASLPAVQRGFIK